jgi:hypothetical protein
MFLERKDAMIDALLMVTVSGTLLTALLIDVCWLCSYLRRSLNPDQ